jgi:hypothetical protein
LKRIIRSIESLWRGTPDSAIAAAMLGSAGVTANFTAARAARDTIFLSYRDVTSLPAMVVAASVLAILIAGTSSRMMQRLPPSVFVPAVFAINGALLVALWGVIVVAPEAGASLVYVQISGVGPILGSGFWLVATERFDPHTAKRRFGEITAAGTLGGLVGGLATERLATTLGLLATLPFLAALSLFCAIQVRALAGPIAAGGGARARRSPERANEQGRSGWRVLAGAPYLRRLAAVVLLGTIGAAMIDYIFKAQAVAALGRGEALMRFFAVYYAAVSLVTFVLQTSASRLALEKLGLASTTSAPSVALLLGCVGTWLAPGLASTTVARGAETAFRGSLFRAGYELFYTPIPAVEKRAAKSVIDVGFGRMGDVIGGSVLRALLLLPAGLQHDAMLAVGIAAAFGALAAASRLGGSYIDTLERNLLDRAVELDLHEPEDLTTRTAMMRTFTAKRSRRLLVDSGTAGAGPQRDHEDPDDELDTDLARLLALQSRDPDRIRRALGSEPLSPTLIPLTIALLGWDRLAGAAASALKRVAAAHTGQLVDALVDPATDFAARRRLARVLSACPSQRAADGLMMGLGDSRFEVRYWCARSLAAIAQKNSLIGIDHDAVLDVIGRETAVGRPIWEAQRLLDSPDEHDGAPGTSFVDEIVEDRASRSLAHVFTLLSLILPAEPLRIAFQGLHTDDAGLRGTALEYLEGVIPSSVRTQLWPFLEEDQRAPLPARSGRPREEVLADLLRSNQSIAMNLAQLKQRDGKP